MYTRGGSATHGTRGEVLFTILGNQRKKKPKNKGKGKVQPKADIKKEPTCFFCKKKGHMKKNYMKHKVWLEKKRYFIFFHLL